MLKKRIIFTLLYNDGFFVQSRNFNLQNVGNADWLNRNYNFQQISKFIDELIIIDISRKKKNTNIFLKDVIKISNNCFIPLTIGGGITNLDIAKKYFSFGADKILINGDHKNNLIIKEIASVYGNQALILTLDYKIIDEKYIIFKNHGSIRINKSFKSYLNEVLDYPSGEIILNSIDRDGVGTGLDLNVVKQLPSRNKKSVILSGGCGNVVHFKSALKNPKVDAVSTANLLNFVGDGLKNAREDLVKNKFNIANWQDLHVNNKLV